MTPARLTYCRLLRALAYLAVVCTVLLTVLAGSSTEWGFMPPAWIWGVL